MNKISLVFLLVLSLAVFTRFINPVSRYAYDHDSDLSAWIFKDMIVDGHFRLIGQQTSSPGLFIGPFFYYLLVPFYLLTRMDPIGTILVPPIIGLLGVGSFYYVLRRTFSLRHAIIGSSLYAASFLIVTTERQIVPTMFIFIWSIWFFYAAWLLQKGKKSGLLLSAVLLALAWHIQFVLVIVGLPLFITALLKIKSFKVKDILLAAFAFVVLSLPFLAFELRHGAMQTRSLLFNSNSAPEVIERTRLEKTVHVMGIAAKNANALFWQRPESVSRYWLPTAIFVFLTMLFLVRKLSKGSYFILASWFGLFIGFFVFHPINLSEYYLGSLNVVWLIAATIILASLRKFGLLVLSIFLIYNLRLIVSWPKSHSGYLNRTAIVEYIAKDAKTHDYPCFAISYMTDPGNDLGYRYLFWIKNLHVNAPKSGSPVYTIVFPHTRANHLDYTVGALGLVLPDYSRYNSQTVDDSCSGQNSNVTDPFFGFTK